MFKINKTLRNILILIAPFIVMVIINEFERPKIKNNSNRYHGAMTINPSGFNPQKCTWECHHHTSSYCQIHHVKFLKPFYKVTDTPYYFVIQTLRGSGNYGIANIVFLVLLFPFTILYFLIKSLNLQDEINQLSKQK